mgnify:CR=1 FL=1
MSFLEKTYNKTDDEDLKINLALIYRHYVAGLKPSKKSKTDFEWVAKAVGTEEVRPQLWNVYATGEYIVATDGHRMHYCKDKRPAGFYCPHTETLIETE